MDQDQRTEGWTLPGHRQSGPRVRLSRIERGQQRQLGNHPTYWKYRHSHLTPAIIATVLYCSIDAILRSPDSLRREGTRLKRYGATSLIAAKQCGAPDFSGYCRAK